MRLVIKGTRDVAMSHAQLRGIEAVFVTEHRGESILDVPDDEATASKVVRWFCEEPTRAPFPDGSCMFYQAPQFRRVVNERPTFSYARR